MAGGGCKECARTSVSRRRNSNKSGARSRGLEYMLTPDQHDALVTGRCVYCGARPDPFNGIDRVDNERGYVEGNVVTACFDCNRAKGQMTVGEFERWAVRIVYRLQRLKTVV
jgi:5-methylcytosine-specific restriction endonuclease McrA